MDEENSQSDNHSEDSAPSSDDQTTTDATDQCQKTETRIVEQNVDYKDAHARAVADYDNLKKETLRLRQEYARYAAGEVVEQMLPVLDNLNKALTQAPTECEQWVNGIRLIREQFQKVFEAAGVQPLGATGEDFDPVKHEALMREKCDGVDSDTVVEIIEPGYKLHDKVLRPAKVIVAE
ncbi:MAG: nucleotide exchange factor GrpE [Patescibacteria group bacterium]